jgi:hypothetical protein
MFIDCFFSIDSITLKAVVRVMASYVDASPGIDPDPLTTLLRFARPDSTSKRRPGVGV